MIELLLVINNYSEYVLNRTDVPQIPKMFMCLFQASYSYFMCFRYHQGLKEVCLPIKVIYMEKTLENLCSKDKVRMYFLNFMMY